jgi:TRAP-type C4-dicarboxylate transport system permease small subunit
MSYFANILERINRITVVIGYIFLLAIMMLTVSDIIYRFTGRVIAGTYELTELGIVVTAGFALFYTTIRQGNIQVTLVTSRLSTRAQAIADSFNSFISTCVWGGLAMAVGFYLHKRGFVGEGYSDLLEIPFFPIKCIWMFALLLVCLAFLVSLSKALRSVVSR